MNTKPFLKWAGGKYRQLDAILRALPPGRRLVEPFAGSAAVYLNAPCECALVCDINRDLINLFLSLRDEGEEFIRFCASLFTPENNTAKRYYALRETFNAEDEMHLRGALLLYLNRHGFNGLVRYNAKGLFNVPFGRYTKPRFPEEELRAFYLKTQETVTEFRAVDFREAFAGLEPGDVVYCDPPYVPLSGTAKFTSYAGTAFGEAEQQDLAVLAAQAQANGIPVIVSNHDVKVTRKLYAKAEIRPFIIRRLISCKGKERGFAPELLALFH